MDQKNESSSLKNKKNLSHQIQNSISLFYNNLKLIKNKYK